MNFLIQLPVPFNAELFPFYCEARNISPEAGITGVYHDFQTLSYEERLHLLQECIQKTELNLNIDVEYLDRAFQVYRSICAMFRGIHEIEHYDGSVLFFRAKTNPGTRGRPDSGMG